MLTQSFDLPVYVGATAWIMHHNKARAYKAVCVSIYVSQKEPVRIIYKLEDEVDIVPLQKPSTEVFATKAELLASL